ncbi:MarR family winged helix-turn-helix transcriptional regulator [Fructobacillus durionis]|uniref:DNA-binding transcriptional regulator, MarR family n=1 Tax=Fructobacillus durionis TaxID=283737 RepID=A0A1I1EP23_9LACO|nr:MarR family transcriptional regulator [Fructobacillus durionis]SFB88402.1 DNA-binding transcriptional regulator, MarR family [Fructobacillus durionis]
MLEYDIFRQMGAISRRAMMMMNHEVQEFGLANNLFLYLVRIVEHEGLTQSELATLIQIDKTTLSRALKKLEDRGYIEKVAGEKNRNFKQLYSTEQGKMIYQKVIQIEHDDVFDKLAALNSEEKEQLMALLSKIN